MTTLYVYCVRSYEGHGPMLYIATLIYFKIYLPLHCVHWHLMQHDFWMKKFIIILRVFWPCVCVCVNGKIEDVFRITMVTNVHV